MSTPFFIQNYQNEDGAIFDKFCLSIAGKVACDVPLKLIFYNVYK